MRATLLSVGALAYHEFRMTLRGPSGLSVIVGVCALAFIDAASQQHLGVVAGVRASMFGCSMLLVPLSLVFIAGAARRDDAVGAGDVVDSRPFPAHALFMGRFLGIYAVALFAYLLVITCGLLAPLVLSGKFASPLTLIHAFTRGIVPLLFITALGYCGVSLARNMLAAAVIMVYWLFVLLWGDFLARVFNFTLTQNWPIYASLALAVIVGTAALRRRQELAGSERRAGILAPVGAVVLLLVGLIGAWCQVGASHDKPLRMDPFALQIASQYAEVSPKAPGVWFPDQHGDLWRTSQADGKVLVFAFWSPHVPDSVMVLESLKEIAEGAQAEQVACVAICLADDHAISPHVAREGRYPFPMVTDTGTHFDPKLKECSPISEVFELGSVPEIYVTDRGRRQVSTFSFDGLAHVPAVMAAIEQAMTVPVPPGVGVERI